MALEAGYFFTRPNACSARDKLKSYLNSKLSSHELTLHDVFQLTDPREIALNQDEVNKYISFQRGILWDIPNRILEHPDASRFHLHGDKSNTVNCLEIAGHAILDWQFDGGDKKVMRLASYALGHHPGFGVLIDNGLSEIRADGAHIGKETVMERTIHFNYQNEIVVVNNFRTPTGLKIANDRFVTRYPEEIKNLLKIYTDGHYQKNRDAVAWARNEAYYKGYDFEFCYGQSRVVIPGSARNYPMHGNKSYF